MAKAFAYTWFPRSNIHVYMLKQGLRKVDLDLAELEVGESAHFKIKSYRGYGDISFTQTPLGVYLLECDLPDPCTKADAKRYMAQMQVLLLEKILKPCFSITYRQIIDDMMPLNFHTVVLSQAKPDDVGYDMVSSHDLEVDLESEASYVSGTTTYVIGQADDSLQVPLFYHAFSEVALSFVYSNLQAMIRLYHDVDAVISDMDHADSKKQLSQHFKLLDSLSREVNERQGKIEHLIKATHEILNIYDTEKLNQRHTSLTKTLNISGSLTRLAQDLDYVETRYREVLDVRLEDINRTLTARLLVHQWPEKKRIWPFR